MTEASKWIPCDVKLPEMYMPVLVCFNQAGDYPMQVAWRQQNPKEKDGWYWAYCGDTVVTAWMPLPKPYKG